MQRARAFYEGTLGFEPGTQTPDGVQYRSGSGTFLVYESAYAGTNKATAMEFEIDDDHFDAEVAQLRGKGVDFDTFEMEGMVWEEGVATISMAGFTAKAAWFRDPDGNIIAISTPAPQ
jgi:catechol 2,3-dioxygenase-like lactoylglutathione lyase family enzyme